MPPDYDTAAWWPAELNDACWDVEMLQGNNSEPLQFALESWMTVTASTSPLPTGDSGGVIASLSAMAATEGA